MKSTDSKHPAAVHYCVMDSPVGNLLLIISQKGLCRIAFTHGDSHQLASILEKYGNPELNHQASQPVINQLTEYFDGNRKKFELAVDLHVPEGFRKRALRYVQTISYGQRRSYAEVAAAANSPAATRAAGSACATNPIPIVIPCHRVVRTDGSIGGFLGGYLGALETKRILLDLEQRHTALTSHARGITTRAHEHTPEFTFT